jgi:Type VI secretion system/phage-baseplate injector OB domain
MKGVSEMALLSSIYRATVLDNTDPQGMGRLQVSVLGSPGASGWATPCVPYNSSESVTVPPVGENVWVMFEDGDPSYPVWMGWFPTPG